MRRVALFCLAALAGAGIGPVGIGAITAARGPDAPPGTAMARLAHDVVVRPGTGPLDLVVTLDHVAEANLAKSLRDLDPAAWVGAHVPLARVQIAPADLEALRSVEGVRAVYPNRNLVQAAIASPPALKLPAAPAPAEPPSDGPTGKGVTIAVVDTGVDGTHPDLRPAMLANMKHSVDPVAPLPFFENTDMTEGHGTMVAGVAAGRGTASGGRHRGAAPGASLVGLGLGEFGTGISYFKVMVAYEWILEHREQYGIRVANNSYGSPTFGRFDPDNPVNLATRSAAEAGIVVVFGMGNGGGELTMSEHASSPWVIAVGATSPAGQVSDFSSGGIEADVMGRDFFGTRLIAGETRSPLDMGLYHPSVVAAGEDIIAPRAATVAPDYPNDPTEPGERLYYKTGSGTSFSGPVVAGVIARVLEANPELNPENVRRVLQITARPIPGAPFHRQGYGQVDPTAAVTLAASLSGRSTDEISQNLENRQRARDADILSALARPISTGTYYWSTFYRPFSHPIRVEPGTRRIKVVTTPSTLKEPGPTLTIRILDAAGLEVGRTMRGVRTFSPATSLEVDLATVSNPRWGEWVVEITNGEPSTNVVPVPTEITVIATFGQSGPPTP